MNQIQGFLKSSVWLSLASIVSKVSSAVSLPLLARLLTPEAVGIYSVIVSLAQSIDNFSNLGVTIAMERNGSQHKTLGGEAVGRLFGVGLVTIVVVNTAVALAIYNLREPLALHWLGQANVTNWLGAAALLICLQPLGSVPLIFLASLQDFRAYALRTALGSIGSGAATVVLGWQFGLTGAVAGLIIAALLQIVWSYAIVKPVLSRMDIRLRCDQFWSEAKAIFKLGFPYYCGNTLLGSLVGLPLMGLVSQYGGLKELGYLRVAQSMASLIGFIPSAIAPATISYLSANLASDPHAYQRMKSLHLRSNSILLLLPAGVVCLMLPQVINAIYGKGYEPAAVLSWLTLWQCVFAGISGLLIQYLVVMGKTIRIAWGSFLGICGWVIGAYLLVPSYHGLGFLIAQLGGQLAGFAFILAPGIKDLATRDRRLFFYLLGAILATAIWTLAAMRLDLSTWWSQALAIGGTLLCLLAYIFALGLQPSERERLTALLKQLNK